MKKLINSALAFVMMVAATQGSAPNTKSTAPNTKSAAPNPKSAAPNTKSAAPDTKSTITTLENAIWRSVQQKKIEQFKQYVSPDAQAVFADGIMTRPDELTAIPKAAMKSVSLSDFKIAILDAQTATLAYLAKIETMAEGKSVFTTYNAGSVWQLTKGNWQAIFHVEVKQTSTK